MSSLRVAKASMNNFVWVFVGWVWNGFGCMESLGLKMVEKLASHVVSTELLITFWTRA